MKWSELDYALTLLFGNLFRRASISSICPAEKTTLPSPYPLFVERETAMLYTAECRFRRLASPEVHPILILLKKSWTIDVQKGYILSGPCSWLTSQSPAKPSPTIRCDSLTSWSLDNQVLINMVDGSCFPKMGQWCVQDASQPALTLLLTRLKAAATKIQTTCNSPLCKSKKIHWENEDK